MSLTQISSKFVGEGKPFKTQEHMAGNLMLVFIPVVLAILFCPGLIFYQSNSGPGAIAVLMCSIFFLVTWVVILFAFSRPLMNAFAKCMPGDGGGAGASTFEPAQTAATFNVDDGTAA